MLHTFTFGMETRLDVMSCPIIARLSASLDHLVKDTNGKEWHPAKANRPIHLETKTRLLGRMSVGEQPHPIRQAESLGRL
jgi:hypothetical protein